MLIVDVDAHHYENESYAQILPFMENEVTKQYAMAYGARGRGSMVPNAMGNQDMSGRVTRYPMRSSEKTEPGQLRDVQLGQRWMDAMGVDYPASSHAGMLCSASTRRRRSRSSCAGPITAG